MAKMANHGYDTPNIVTIGLPNVAALNRALAKIKAANILHYAWVEPDFNFGFTSIATAPIQGEQRKVLANYRVYNWPVAKNTERPILNGEDAGGTPAGPANAGGSDASLLRP